MSTKKILIHASFKPIKQKLTYCVQRNRKQPRYGLKPRGLWYAPGRAWLDWCIKEDYYAHKYKYFYVVVPMYTTLDKPNVNRILKINNEDEFDLFNFKYGFSTKKNNIDDFIMVRWDDVAKDFGGIEIIPLIETRLYLQFSKIINPDADILIKKYRKYGFNVNEITMFWLDALDVPSGCIWNPKAIKKFYQIKKKLKCVNGVNNKELTLQRIHF
ncbi:putative phage structural protein [Tupanvirus deep ocean]|uniref:Phage structural protein n=2 Tax=Tupanvirus TaxID=2094720 RepID=A0AC62A9B5_9VIRU|nr:putative phage structural protein [Tupanvirus deep ocean]QKU34372.1 putative phage structural protein [Tupanvirus deep ocean]